jgi:hypothetical protein
MVRRLTATLLAACLSTPFALAAETCVRPAEKAAFDVTALKSRLMVTALVCNGQERYNAFVTRYRSELLRQDKVLAGYFNRVFGRRGQQFRDEYTTQLANSESQNGLQQGSLFCQNNTPLFDRVMAVPAQGLADFAAGQAIAQPIAVIPCPAQPAPKKPKSKAKTVTAKNTKTPT